MLLEEVVNSEVDVAVVDLGDPYRFSLQQRLFLSEQEEQLRRKIAADSGSLSVTFKQACQNLKYWSYHHFQGINALKMVNGWLHC